MKTQGRSWPCLASFLLVALAVVGCQPEQGVAVNNTSDSDLKIWHQYTGHPPTLWIDRMPPGDGGEWRGNLFNSSASCEDASLIAQDARGKRYVFGPPLCKGQRWDVGSSSSGRGPSPSPTREGPLAAPFT